MRTCKKFLPFVDLKMRGERPWRIARNEQENFLLILKSRFNSNSMVVIKLTEYYNSIKIRVMIQQRLGGVVGYHASLTH